MIKRFWIILVLVLHIGCTVHSEPINKVNIIDSHNIRFVQKIMQLENGSLQNPVWTPDSKYIFVTGSTGIWRFDPQHLERKPILFDQYRSPMAINPDGISVTSLDTNGNIVIWNIENGQYIDTFYDSSSRLIWITDIVFSPDGSQLAIGFGGGTNMGWTGALTVWDANTREIIIDTQRVIDDPVFLDYSSDGTKLMAGGYSGLSAWNTNTWDTLQMPYGSYIGNLEYNTTASKIVYWDWRNQIVGLFDMDDFESQSCLLSNSNTVTYSGGDIAFSPTDNDILAVSQYGQLAIWNTSTCELLNRIPTQVRNIEFSPDGSHLVGVNGKGFHIYNAETLEQIDHASGFVANIGNMLFSEDGDLFAYEINSQSSVRVLETNYFSEVAHISADTYHHDDILPIFTNHITFQPEYMEDIGSANIVPARVILNRLGGHCGQGWKHKQQIQNFIEENSPVDTPILKIWEWHNHPIHLLCLSPDQKTIISTHTLNSSASPASYDQLVSVWDIPTGKIRFQIPISATIHDLAFSPTEQSFAIIEHKQISYWDSISGEIINTIDEEYRNGIFLNNSPIFSARTHWGDLVFLNLQTGEQVHSIENQQIENMIASPNGTLFAFKLQNNTIEIWGVR